MKRFLLTLSIIVSALCSMAQKIPARPSPPKLVNDYAGILTADQRESLERKLVAYDDSTSNQIVIVTVKTLDDYAPVDYAVKLGREWGVGNKKNNNGVVLLVSTEPNNRQIFIAPGYGLEGAIPDIIAKSIIDNQIRPNFKADDYYRGLDLGTTAIMRAAVGEYKAPAGYGSSKGRGKGGGSILGVIIILFIVMMLAGRGGGGGGMASRRGFGDIATGALLGSLLSGGRGGGGGFGGGSSGGGGFGGFGGGSFGGGGSGGSW